MPRTRAIFLTALIALATFLALSALAPVARSKTNAPPSDEVAAAIRFASREWAVSERSMLKVANCESSYNPNARNGSYVGLYQHSTSKKYGWPVRVRNFNAYVDRHNSREPNKLERMSGTWNAPIDAARVTAWMVKTQTGWGPWSCKP